MTNDHLHIIYHRGYQKYIFLLFKQVLNQALSAVKQTKDDLKENLGQKEERFRSDARALHPDVHAESA